LKGPVSCDNCRDDGTGIYDGNSAAPQFGASSVGAPASPSYNKYGIDFHLDPSAGLIILNEFLRRALLYFGHFGVYPTPCAADRITPLLSILPVGYNFAIADFAAHEYVGIVRYYVTTCLVGTHLGLILDPPELLSF
jgi:hypothetical protein